MATKKTNKSTKKGGGRVGAFLAGATAATAAGAYFLYGPNGAKNRKKIEGWTLKAKGDVLSKIENAREVSEDRYHDIVDSVTAKYAKLKHVGDEKANKLNSELKRHWNRIKRDTKETASTTQKRTNTARRKLAVKIAPNEKKPRSK
ncbi:MAG: hypothetical protein U5L75_00045 [Candidatus Campbellbacteria bacterium]|nr:hypothetical protein [Candidatus Campbellbacteria bacterium]